MNTTWVHDLYDELLIDLFLDQRPAAETDAFCTFIVKELGAGKLLDQGCGVGTIAIPLAARGLSVVGVDLIASYTDEAQRRATAAAVDARATFIAGDAASFVAEGCDGAYTVGTCIGHGDDRQTRGIFEAAATSLRPGGLYLVEFLGAPGILRHFERHQILRGTSRHGPVTLLRTSELDLPRGLLHKTWTWLLPSGEERVRRSSVRLYFPHELVERLHDAGFVTDAPSMGVFGDLTKRPLDSDDLRCLILAKKAG
jgi:SAM-dependent methyltransferase